MPEQVTTKSASKSCVVFSDNSRREVRVIYEPGGKPLFCAADVASCMGYSAPSKAVTRVDVEPKYRRFVPWVSAHKRGQSEAICFDKKGVERFLRHGVPSEDVERWVLDVLIPRAEDVGKDREYEYEEPTPEPDGGFEAGVKAADVSPSILERLDSIILEAILLKREIQKSV